MDVFVYISKNKMIFNDVKEYKIDKELGLLVIEGTEKVSKKFGKFFFSITNILYFIVEDEIKPEIKETVDKVEPVEPKPTKSGKKPKKE